ncbi:hypothetical protein M407DRAFT_23236 [Tulasnella calospora MUT 4182]|uniref:F-box domain-containing protein n=1 Tax=Tulasnella calospora MUT 4182 TaxID=1051891 RepID=A0A0C3QAZ6_9AGAM|nr:hypothetical protein M407DRAFT_23236 [Tulasnella calospora MUT 4182]
MTTAAKLPQHVLDTRYLQELRERILPQCQPSASEEGQQAATYTVKCDLADAAERRYCDCDPDECGERRYCDCDPDERGEEGSDEESDEKDGWFCSYRSIEDEYKMHAVLERARLHIEADPSAFSETIYREILERCNLEQTKVLEAQAQERRYSDDELQTSPPPSSPCGFPPFSFQHLPPEILVEIALLAQASNPHAHIALSHVDARLRAFVNSTPLLWSRVDFLYPLRVVDCYLERSTDNLLRVMALPPLHVSSAHNPVLQDLKADENNKLKEFLGALCPHRHRILSLRLRSDDLTFNVSGENEGQMPAHNFLWDGAMVELKLLDLELDAWTWEGMKVLPSYRIKELHLHGPWTTDYLPLFSLSLKSLVITSDHTPFSQIFDALQAAPRLVNLALRDMSFTGIGEKKGPVLNLDHLDSLSLIRIVGSAAEALFSCITSTNSNSFLFPNRRFNIST